MYFGSAPAMMQMMRGFSAFPSQGMGAAMFDEEIIDYTEE